MTTGVGAVVSTVTVAAPADGKLPWPLALMPTVAVPARTAATTSPSPMFPVTAVTVTVYVVGVTFVTVACRGPVVGSLPLRSMPTSVPSNPVTGWSKTTSKTTAVGSFVGAAGSAQRRW